MKLMEGTAKVTPSHITQLPLEYLYPRSHVLRRKAGKVNGSAFSCIN